jgi:hypothetical protein
MLLRDVVFKVPIGARARHIALAANILRSRLVAHPWNANLQLSADMSTLEIMVHIEALVVAAFAILISLSGIASLWAFRKIARMAS